MLYTKLAKYYDFIHTFRDYKGQVEFLVDVMNKYCPETEAVLDICCGTGSHAVLLAEKGYKVTGVDMSEEMLSLAREKNKNSDNPLYVQADMRTLNLHFDAVYDMAYCLGVSFAQLSSYSEIYQTLDSVHDVLKPGGVFVFDVPNGWRMLHVETRKYFGEDRNAKVVRIDTGYIDKMRRMMHLDSVWIINEGGTHSIESSTEEIRIFFPDELEEVVSQRFEILAMLGDRSLNSSFQPDSEHIVMVLRKRGDGCT